MSTTKENSGELNKQTNGVPTSPGNQERLPQKEILEMDVGDSPRGKRDGGWGGVQKEETAVGRPEAARSQ